ncbi:MAG: NAD-dependent epimerase/dehydratase family protein, partial [bacterium]|nr:NAD-dependent epimerase/dehydratase family protein [bacterium]
MVVTGASGHLGVNIVRNLLEKGYKVRAIVKTDKRAVLGLPCEVIKADILSKEELLNAFKNAHAIIHSAAHISITSFEKDAIWKTNVQGTRNVIDAAFSSNVEKLIYIGSIHAFQDDHNTVDENSPLVDKNGSIYDITKAEGVKAVQEARKSGLNAVIICPTALIGPNDYKPSLMGRFLISLAQQRVPALVDGGFDFVDSRDVAEAVSRALTNGNGTYIISGQYLKVAELSQLWCKTAGVKCPSIILPLKMAQTGAHIALFFSRILKFSPLYTPEALKALSWKSS